MLALSLGASTIDGSPSRRFRARPRCFELAVDRRKSRCRLARRGHHEHRKTLQERTLPSACLPPEFALPGREVYIRRVGRSIVLVPKDDPWGGLEEALERFSEDFMSERVEPAVDERESF